MFSMLAVLVYLAAIGIPSWLLYRYGSQAWYWHGVSLACGVSLGFVPIPTSLQGQFYDLALGFVFILLLIWGAGGLIFFHSPAHGPGHHATHA